MTKLVVWCMSHHRHSNHHHHRQALTLLLTYEPRIIHACSNRLGRAGMQTQLNWQLP